MITFYLLDEADGSIRCPLPQHDGFTLSPIANSPGSIKLRYPVQGRNWDQLAEHLGEDRDADAPIEMWVGGSRQRARQGLLLDFGGDESMPGDVVEFVGVFDEWRLTDAVLKPGGGETSPDPEAEPDDDVKFFSATGGRMLLTVVQDAQARGTLAALTVDFDENVDSNGVPWSKVQTLKFSPGTTVLAVAQALNEYQLIEFEVRNRVLRAFEHGTRGVDRTLQTPPIRFIRGRDVRDAPRRRTIREGFTDLLLGGAEGIYREINDPQARARRGRQIERYRSQGSITTEGGLLNYGAIELERGTKALDERTHGLAFKPGSPVPLVDFEDGDWVWSKMGSRNRRLRIRQLTITEDSKRTREGTVTLNDAIAEREAQLAQRIKGIEGGATITGTSQARPVVEGPDTTPPARVLGLTVDTDALTDPDGTVTAVLLASWAPVTEDEGGGATTDVEGYRLQYRYLAIPGVTEWISTSPFLESFGDVEGLRPGQPISVRVRAYDSSGNIGLPSGEVSIVTAEDATPPGVPTQSAASNYIGILAVPWDGNAVGGVPIRETDAGFSHINIYVDEAANFDPLLGEGLKIGAMRTAGTYGWADGIAGTTYYVRLTSEDRSGNESEASVPTAATVGLVEEGDVGSVNIGVLTAGILKVLMIVADGQIVTSEGPDGVKIDNDGLRCLTPAGVPVLAFSIATGLLELIGKFSTSETGGARIEIDPIGPDGNPTMSLFSDNGVFGGARLNAFDRSGGRTGLGINSGPAGGSVNDPFSRVFLQHDSAALEIVGGSPTITRGGVVLVTDDLAILALNAADGSGDQLGSVQIDPDGQVFVSGDGDVVLTRSGGSQMTVSDTRIRFFTGGSRRAEVSRDGVFADRYHSFSEAVDYRAVLRTNDGGDIFFYWTGGTLNIGTGTSFVKSFVIDHPTDPDRYLVHGCTESPHAGVEYWGEVEIVDGEAEVTLPDYFEAATRPDGRSVQVSVVLDDVEDARPAPPRLVEEGAELPSRRPRPVPPTVAATPVRHGRFRVACNGDDGTRVAWLVKATRADVEPFDVEPLRADVLVHGDGPYRHLSRRP